VLERCYRMLKHKFQIESWSQPLFQMLTPQYWEFLGKLFFAIHYTHCGAHSILVPQSFMWNASVTGMNLFIYQIGFYAANLEECVVNSFEPHSIQMQQGPGIDSPLLHYANIHSRSSFQRMEFFLQLHCSQV
jgi:hypothetical protein